MSKRNDRGLRFYHEVLGLERLNYGLWRPGDEVTLENLKAAQKRYEDFLIDHIPSGTSRVLDVGCGTSALVASLQQRGMDAEGLSPDIHQKRFFMERIDGKFHHCRFEHFDPQEEYDCLVMSESAQYIPQRELLHTASRCLREDGLLMICDYFVADHTTGHFRKSGHHLEAFKAEAAARGFELIKEEDITARVLKTLEFVKQSRAKLALAVEIGTERFREKHPYLTRFVLWAFKKKRRRLEEKMEVLDPDKFPTQKSYNFLLFRRTAGSSGSREPRSLPLEAVAAGAALLQTVR